MKSVASQVRVLEVGDQLVLETKEGSKTQRSVAASAAKMKYTVNQKGFFGVAANGDLESTCFIRVTRTR